MAEHGHRRRVADENDIDSGLLRDLGALHDFEVIGLDLELERFDLSLENRRRTQNAVCTEAATAMAVGKLARYLALAWALAWL